MGRSHLQSFKKALWYPNLTHLFGPALSDSDTSGRNYAALRNTAPVKFSSCYYTFLSLDGILTEEQQHQSVCWWLAGGVFVFYLLFSIFFFLLGDTVTLHEALWPHRNRLQVWFSPQGVFVYGVCMFSLPLSRFFQQVLRPPATDYIKSKVLWVHLVDIIRASHIWGHLIPYFWNYLFFLCKYVKKYSINIAERSVNMEWAKAQRADYVWGQKGGRREWSARSLIATATPSSAPTHTKPPRISFPSGFKRHADLLRSSSQRC